MEWVHAQGALTEECMNFLHGKVRAYGSRGHFPSFTQAIHRDRLYSFTWLEARKQRAGARRPQNLQRQQIKDLHLESTVSLLVVRERHYYVLVWMLTGGAKKVG